MTLNSLDRYDTNNARAPSTNYVEHYGGGREFKRYALYKEMKFFIQKSVMGEGVKIEF